jgi:hypothetical protein
MCTIMYTSKLIKVLCSRRLSNSSLLNKLLEASCKTSYRIQSYPYAHYHTTRGIKIYAVDTNDTTIKAPIQSFYRSALDEH